MIDECVRSRPLTATRPSDRKERRGRVVIFDVQRRFWVSEAVPIGCDAKKYRLWIQFYWRNPTFEGFFFWRQCMMRVQEEVLPQRLLKPLDFTIGCDVFDFLTTIRLHDLKICFFAHLTNLLRHERAPKMIIDGNRASQQLRVSGRFPKPSKNIWGLQNNSHHPNSSRTNTRNLAMGGFFYPPDQVTLRTYSSFSVFRVTLSTSASQADLVLFVSSFPPSARMATSMNVRLVFFVFPVLASVGRLTRKCLEEWSDPKVVCGYVVGAFQRWLASWQN